MIESEQQTANSEEQAPATCYQLFAKGENGYEINRVDHQAV